MRVRSTFCSFVQLELRPKHTGYVRTVLTSQPCPKQNRRPETRKHNDDPPVMDLGVFNLDFFRHNEKELLT